MCVFLPSKKAEFQYFVHSFVFRAIHSKSLPQSFAPSWIRFDERHGLSSGANFSPYFATKMWTRKKLNNGKCKQAKQVSLMETENVYIQLIAKLWEVWNTSLQFEKKRKKFQSSFSILWKKEMKKLNSRHVHMYSSIVQGRHILGPSQHQLSLLSRYRKYALWYVCETFGLQYTHTASNKALWIQHSFSAN